MHRHSTATLMGLTKRELVEYVRIAEHNREVAEETLKQQAENVKEWMPVVHGRWINARDGWGICSNCHRVDEIHKLATHCRFCGAKMDGERREGD